MDIIEILAAILLAPIWIPARIVVMGALLIHSLRREKVTSAE